MIAATANIPLAVAHELVRRYDGSEDSARTVMAAAELSEDLATKLAGVDDPADAADHVEDAAWKWAGDAGAIAAWDVAHAVNIDASHSLDAKWNNGEAVWCVDLGDVRIIWSADRICSGDPVPCVTWVVDHKDDDGMYIPLDDGWWVGRVEPEPDPTEAIQEITRLIRKYAQEGGTPR